MLIKISRVDPPAKRVSDRGSLDSGELATLSTRELVKLRKSSESSKIERDILNKLLMSVNGFNVCCIKVM